MIKGQEDPIELYLKQLQISINSVGATQENSSLTIKINKSYKRSYT